MEMEFTKINILRDFDAGVKSLQNPSIISRFFSRSGIEKLFQMYSFWQWGALILVIVATFCIKFLIIRVRTLKSLVSSSQPLLQPMEDDFDDSDDDESSPVATSEDEEFDSKSPFEDRRQVYEDFRVAGSSNLKLRRRRSLRDRFSWSDFAAGESVVKLWDSLGLGLDFEDSSRSEISIWDLNRDLKIRSILGGTRQIPAVVMSSPAVMLSAEENDSDSVVLAAYDTRVGGEMPAIYAEWRSGQGEVVGINSGGVEKVYFTNGVVTVGDMRNVKSQVENSTESQDDTWWDADAVIDEFEDEL